MTTTNIPLAARMRPNTLDEIYGQEKILGKGKYLRRMIDTDMLSSIVLYGPPGTGKTTIASVIAHVTNNVFVSINATTAGKDDMKKAVAKATKQLEETGQKTVLFIDEIHRFNKLQQDFLLPYVENGTVILIGATTENPYFEINKALLSRGQIFELVPLGKDAILNILDRGITYLTNDGYTITIDDDAKNFWADCADGDARQVLNALDLAVRSADANTVHITLEVAGECIQKKIKKYDKDGDNHYDSISAMIESMKHSEVDAALYYLARMLDRGEDPKYIARRCMVCAYRDIGFADPQAFTVAVNAFHAVNIIGLPECADALAMSVIYNSLAPKSNTIPEALQRATVDAQNIGSIDIPATLKDESYKSAWKLGHGGVSDVFASPCHFDGFDCTPDEIKGHRYYIPSDFGLETTQKNYYEWVESMKAYFKNTFNAEVG